MKKGLLSLLIVFMCISSIHAQNITNAEYFVDTDPGVGNGTTVTVPSPGSIVNFTVSVPTGAYSTGFHFVAVRVKDANGKWGLYDKRGFYVSNSAVNSGNITNAEYFFDADPGIGNGASVSVGTSGATVNFTAAIPTSLSPGFHFLAIRVKDANGYWGLFDKRGFYISNSATAAANITAAEYFIDTDPSVGNGTPLSVGTSGAVVNFTASISTSVSAGFHFLAIRVKDANGYWGLYEKRGFYVSNAAANSANITAAEYFFDSDPGVGNGTSLSVGTSGAVVNFTASIPTSLSAGFHFLAIRTKDANGYWGLYEKRGFYVSNLASNSPSITAAEYFFDADPGAGNGTALTITTPGDIVTQTFMVPDPGLSLGTHYLGIRVKDANGKWGLYEFDTLTVGNSTITCPANSTVNAGAGQCTAVVNNIDPVINPVQAYTYSLSGATTGNGNGTASGQTFNSGVTTVTYTLTGSPSVNCSFTVTVNTSVVPSVSIGASATTICAGTNVIFTATPTNGGSPSYQWKLNGNNVGTNSATYQNSALANNDVVTVVMTSSIACANPITATSNAITMTVNSIVTPSVSIGATATTICSGTNVIFTATPVNGGTPSYQWKLNGGNVGTNSATYQNAGLANNDVITVVMTSSLTCVSQPTATSNAITMTVNPTVTPSVSIGATATNICSGTNVIFTATPTNGGTPSYQWKLNGNNVGTNSATYQNSTLANNDVITVVMTSSLACAIPPTATSNAITMTVTLTVTPSVSIGASATTICAGTNVIFTATPINGGTPSYQWKLNGNNVGTNSATYQNAGLANNDVITVVMTSSLTCVSQPTATSNSITMTVTSTVVPSVSIGATATTICSGTNVIFTATPVNGGSPSYQWKLNGNNVGTNSATYQNATLANNDVITVVMTSSLACANPTTATSNAITMTVTLTVTPSVSIAATATTICAGTNVIFTATPINGGTPSYQWKLNGNNVGTNSATYQNSSLANNDVVTCVMTTSLTCVTSTTATSNAITMTVNPILTPSVSIGATATTICAGTNVTFTATPTNGGTPSYQWKLNGNNVGTNSATYQNSSLANNDVVTCVMTTSLTCVSSTSATSNAITMTVNPILTPSVSIGATATTICIGTSVTFTATPTNGGAPSYQWKLNGNNVGTNSATYQNSSLANNDVVTCVMTTSLTCVSSTSATSNAITITVNLPPSITTNPLSQTVFVGSNVTFTVVATGNGLTYQWRKGGVNITGATGSSYTINNISVTDAGNYDVVVTGTCSPSATSSIAVLTVNTVTITTQPLSQSICSGSNVTFSVVASGVNLTYQWQINTSGSFTNISGATNSTLSLNAVTLSMNGNSYRCVVSGLLNSSAAVLTVFPLPVITLATSRSTALLPGQFLTITANMSPTGGTIIWKKNGVVISGYNAFSIPNLTVDDAGTYNATYTDLNGCVKISNDISVAAQAYDKLFVYPNPNNGQFQIRFYNTAGEAVTVNIYDSKGASVYHRSLVIGPLSYSRIDVDLIKFGGGTYVVELLDANGNRIGISKRFVIGR